MATWSQTFLVRFCVYEGIATGGQLIFDKEHKENMSLCEINFNNFFSPETLEGLSLQMIR